MATALRGMAHLISPAADIHLESAGSLANAEVLKEPREDVLVRRFARYLGQFVQRLAQFHAHHFEAEAAADRLLRMRQRFIRTLKRGVLPRVDGQATLALRAI